MLLARARELRVSVSSYIEAAEGNIRGWVDGAAIRIRVREPGLIAFLRDGQFKVMEATGASGGDLKTLARRREVEREVLDIPEEAPACDRPVSGYLEGSDEAGSITKYGLIVLELDLQVRSRA